MEYKEKKNKGNRYVYRILGTIFLLIAIGLLYLVFGTGVHLKMLIAIIAVGAGWYGGFLMKASFRKQSYDLTYQFTEEGITVIHRWGKDQIPFDQVLTVRQIQPDPTMSYKILQIRTKKDQYVISFNGNVRDCDILYDFVDKRTNKDEEQDFREVD